MRIGEKTTEASYRRFYGVAAGAFICLLAALVIYPVLTKAKADVVFLRTTFPSGQVQETVSVEKPDNLFLDIVPQEDPEQRLVAMLSQDDVQVAYEKLQDDDQAHWQVVRMRVTGYCSCAKCCGKYADGVTASNHRIQKGDVFVAADKFYRFGTDMIIPGYNNAKPVEVRDRGRAIKGNKLDLYFDTHSRAQKWGVKYLDVLVKTGE